MLLSLCFIILDILSVTYVIPSRGLPDGINPFWELAFVFKCLTDTIVLDDFKTALDRLQEHNMQRLGSIFSDTADIGANDTRIRSPWSAEAKASERVARDNP